MKLVIVMSIILLLCFPIPKCLAVPTWSPVLIPERETINANEIVHLSVFLVGEGNITDNRFHISTDQSMIFIRDGREFAGILMFKENNLNRFSAKEDYYGMLIPLAESGGSETTGLANNTITRNVQPINTLAINGTRPGDHIISAVFLYSDETGQYFASDKEITIHVNSWSEQYQNWINVIVVVFTFLSLVIGVSFNNEIKNYVRKSFWRKKGTKKELIVSAEQLMDWLKTL